MRTCSAWLSAGVALQVVALAAAAGALWYASEYVPDVPVRMSGKGITSSPRSNFGIGVVVLFVAATVLSGVLNLVGLIRGPRTRACWAFGLPSLCLTAAPGAWVAAVQVMGLVSRVFRLAAAFM